MIDESLKGFINDDIKWMVDNILNRSYPTKDLSEELTEIINNYQEEEAYDWGEDMITKVIALLNEEFAPDTETENAAYEIWYIQWYINWQKK